MRKRLFSAAWLLLLAAGFTFGVSLAALAAPGKGIGNGPPAGLDCPEGQNVVVHLKRHINDLQGAQVAVNLATVLESQVIDMPGNSPDQPVNVTLFLTLQGPRLVDPANPQDLKFGSIDLTLEDLTKGFLEAGGTIYLCPLCAIEIGLNPAEDPELLYADDYPGQVKIAAKPDIVKTFLCAQKVLDF